MKEGREEREGSKKREDTGAEKRSSGAKLENEERGSKEGGGIEIEWETDEVDAGREVEEDARREVEEESAGREVEEIEVEGVCLVAVNEETSKIKEGS